MKNPVIEINWNDLNMNVEEEKRLWNEVVDVLQKYGYENYHYIELEKGKVIQRFIHNSTVL